MKENRKLPEGINEEQATLLVQGAQKHLNDPTVVPGEDQELFYGESERSIGGDSDGTAG